MMYFLSSISAEKLRLVESSRLPVKDVGFEYGRLILGLGKGARDQVTTHPRVYTSAVDSRKVP